MVYIRPGVTTQTTGAQAGAGTVNGLVIALVGSAPKGPAAPTLVTNRVDALRIFGDDMQYTDLQGWSIPEALRLIYDNDMGLSPQVYVCRTGTTQSSVLLGNAGATTGAWTASVLASALGGSSGAGTSIQYDGTNTVTVTPPSSAPAGVATETYTGFGTNATWAAIAAAINARSALVNLTLSGSDGPAQAGTTSNLTTGGTDGANATAAQINSTLDTLLNVRYGQQPIHIIVPLFSDNATSGVTLHALTDAEAMLGNGSYQRPQVFGSVATGMSVAQITTLLGQLVPTENGGDSGRCTLVTNFAPWFTDPATNAPRQYPGWALASAYAAICASLAPSVPRGRKMPNRIVRCAENFLYSDETTLLTNGGQTANPQGRFIDQVTTAVQTSYRREQSIQTQEDVWTTQLQWTLNEEAIEIQAGSVGGQYLDLVVGLNLLGFAEQGLMASSTHFTYMSQADPRDWETDITWVALFPLRNITMKTYLAPPTPQSSSSVATF